MEKLPLQFSSRELTDFCRRNQITSLAFFGSVLTERFHTGSDVDVLVTFAPEARIGFLTLSRIKRELSELLDKPVDVTTPDALKASLRDSVLNNARVVYAAG